MREKKLNCKHNILLCMIHLKRDKNVCFTRDVINYNLEHRAEMTVLGSLKCT